jgi:Domain of unknown function (DUF3899)
VKKYYKKIFTIVFSISAMSIIFCPFVEGTSFAMKYINTLFYFSMLSFTVGGFLFVTERGFFKVTKYGFKKLARMNKKKVEELLEEDDPKDDKSILYEQKRFALTLPFLLSGLILAMLSTIISVIMYT